MKVDTIKVSRHYINRKGSFNKRKGKITIHSPERINLSIEQEAKLLKFLEEL